MSYALQQQFAMFDMNGDGTLDMQELMNLLMSSAGGRPLSYADAQMFMHNFDFDRNGRITINELCAGLQSFAPPQPMFPGFSSTMSSTTTTTSSTFGAPMMGGMQPMMGGMQPNMGGMQPNMGGMQPMMGGMQMQPMMGGMQMQPMMGGEPPPQQPAAPPAVHAGIALPEEPTELSAEDRYHIVNVHSKRRLFASVESQSADGTDGTGATPEKAFTKDDQVWRFEPQSDITVSIDGGPQQKTYLIVNVASNRKLFASRPTKGSRGDTDNVGALAGDERLHDQVWKMVKQDEGSYILQNWETERKLYAPASEVEPEPSPRPALHSARRAPAALLSGRCVRILAPQIRAPHRRRHRLARGVWRRRRGIQRARHAEVDAGEAVTRRHAEVGSGEAVTTPRGYALLAHAAVRRRRAGGAQAAKRVGGRRQEEIEMRSRCDHDARGSQRGSSDHTV